MASTLGGIAFDGEIWIGRISFGSSAFPLSPGLSYLADRITLTVFSDLVTDAPKATQITFPNVRSLRFWAEVSPADSDIALHFAEVDEPGIELTRQQRGGNTGELASLGFQDLEVSQHVGNAASFVGTPKRVSILTHHWAVEFVYSGDPEVALTRL